MTKRSAPVPRRLDHAARNPRWSREARVLACLATLSAPALTSSQVHAAAGQWQAGAKLGAAWLDGAGFGPSADGYLRRGLTEAIDLDLHLSGSVFPFQSDSNLPTRQPTPWALAVSPGVSYRWDVLRAVPYAGIGIGAYAWGGEGRVQAFQHFGASLRLGLDYWLSRDVVLGVQANAHCTGMDGSVIFPWFQLGVGAAHAWGW